MNIQRLHRDVAPTLPQDEEGWPLTAPGERVSEAQAGDPAPRRDEEIPAQLG